MTGAGKRTRRTQQPPEAPSFRRVQLGKALRDGRVKVGMTQQDAADLLECGQGKINKIETALVNRIKMAELNTLLAAYGITGEEAEQLREFARTAPSSRGRYSGYRSNLPSFSRRLLDLEPNARRVRTYQVESMPAVLQDEAFMRLVFTLIGQADVESIVKARLERQKIFDAKGRPEFEFVLAESCLRKHMGRPDIFAGQLRHLGKLSERDGINIRVLNDSAPIQPESYAFTWMIFAPEVMSEFVYVEHATGATYLDDRDDVEKYRSRWDRLSAASLSVNDSRLFIRNMADEYGKKEMRS